MKVLEWYAMKTQQLLSRPAEYDNYSVQLRGITHKGPKCPEAYTSFKSKPGVWGDSISKVLYLTFG